MKRFCALAVSLALCGCATTNVEDVTTLGTVTDTASISPREQKLFGEADKLHEDLEKHGLILRDPQAEEYVNAIARAMLPTIPTNAVRYRVYIVKDASVNAFAIPNGNIYLNVGLLTRLDSEAKLAFVIGHEGSHVYNRHAFKGLVERQYTVAGAHVADTLLLGTGIAYLATAQHLSAFSRDMESEADRDSVAYLGSTQYDRRDGVGALALLGEVKHDKETTTVWSSHPAQAQRLADVGAYLNDHPAPQSAAQRGAEKYETFRRPLAELTVRLRLLNQQFELAQDLAQTEAAKQPDSALWQCLLGEAVYGKAAFPAAAAREHAWLYDKTEIDPIAEKFGTDANANYAAARQFFEAGLKQDQTYAPAKRGIGLIAYQQKDYDEASRYFQEYLTSRDIKDRKYIESLISTMSR